MKTFGPLYAGTLRYPHTDFFPVLEVGTTQETEFPYRKGKCLVFRFPKKYAAFYLGVLWRVTKNPRSLTDEDIDILFFKALKVSKVWKAKELKEEKWEPEHVEF